MRRCATRTLRVYRNRPALPATTGPAAWRHGGVEDFSSSGRITVLGRRPARERIAYGASLGTQVREDTTLSRACDGEHGQGQRTDAASARVEYRW